MRISAIIRSGLLLAFAASLAACGGSSEGGIRNNRLYVLFYDEVNDENVLTSIDANLPANVVTIGSFSYLNNAVFGMDRRPANGGLYTYSQDDESLLRISPSNGSITVIGENTLDPAIPVGLDFNPVTDQLRVVGRSDINFRVDPTDGSLIAQDTNLNPDADVTDIAYTNNTNSAVVTTLYGIDTDDDTLVRIGGVDGTPSPNLGAVTTIGPLGIALDPDEDLACFDIDAEGNAWMLISAWNGLSFDNDLYSVDLATGAATYVGTLNSSLEVVGMTARN